MSLQVTNDNKLGFGCMRLPVLDGKSADVDIEEFAKMANLFLDSGFTYFDTSFVYHDGHSEDAVHKALVERHPRDSYTIATKFPTMLVKTEDQVDEFFQQQLKNLGVDYFNFYLLHILMTQYIGADWKDGVVESCHLFEHLRKWKEQGLAKHIGFSFHDSHDVLDRLLTEHPEVEFVQVVVNYYDWDSLWIQTKQNLEVIRKHGKVAIAMEPVKGGYLAAVPEECLELMHSFDKDATPSSWAIRFAASQPDVFKVLSGMSTMQQVENNVSYMRDFKPLTDKEQEMLFECAKILRRHGALAEDDFSKYAGIKYHGVPLDAIMQTYNALPVQPDPGFAADNNYLRQELLKTGVSDIHKPWPEEKVVVDGKDITAEVEKAWDTLVKYSF